MTQRPQQRIAMSPSLLLLIRRLWRLSTMRINWLLRLDYFIMFLRLFFNLKHRFWIQILPRISRTSRDQYPLNPSLPQVEWAITSIQQGGRKYTLNVEFGTVDGPGEVVTDPIFLVVQVLALSLLLSLIIVAYVIITCCHRLPSDFLHASNLG